MKTDSFISSHFGTAPGNDCDAVIDFFGGAAVPSGTPRSFITRRAPTTVLALRAERTSR